MRAEPSASYSSVRQLESSEALTVAAICGYIGIDVGGGRRFSDSVLERIAPRVWDLQAAWIPHPWPQSRGRAETATNFSAGRVRLTEDEEIDGHANSDQGQEDGEGDCIARDVAGLPGAGAEIPNQREVLDHSGDQDDDAKENNGHAGPDGEARAMRRLMSIRTANLAEKEAEARDRKAYSHESQAGADPGEEGALSGEVNARILFRSLCHAVDCTRSGAAGGRR